MELVKEYEQIFRAFVETKPASAVLISDLSSTGDDIRFDVAYGDRIFKFCIAPTHGVYRTSITHKVLNPAKGEPLLWCCGQGITVYVGDTREFSLRRAMNVFERKVQVYEQWHKDKFCSLRKLSNILSLLSEYPNADLEFLLQKEAD